jgi:hypothetical protein
MKKIILLIVTIVTVAIASMCIAPIKPIPPAGCTYADAVLIKQGTNCYWIYNNCGY